MLRKDFVTPSIFNLKSQCFTLVSAPAIKKYRVCVFECSFKGLRRRATIHGVSFGHQYRSPIYCIE